MKDRTKMPKLTVVTFGLITVGFVLFSIASYLVRLTLCGELTFEGEG